MAQSQLLKIKFRIISFTGEDPEYPVTELLTQSPQSKGWQSPRFCDYPQEIILQLMSATRIKQLQFLSHQCKIASKIEIFVYMPDLYSNQQQEDFKFKKLGYLSLDNNERSGFQARELKSVYIDNAAVYVKLLFQKCHSNKYNLFNQVGLIALTIFGETIKSQQERIHNPDPLPKGFETLEYEMQFDNTTLERLRVLQLAKEKALKFEDYEEAKRLKDGIERLKQIGTQLSYLEERKAIALQKEDYDSCQIIKSEIQRLRNAVTPEALLGKYGEQVSGFGAFNELPPVQRSRGPPGMMGGVIQNQQIDEMALRDLQLKERQFSSKSPASYQPMMSQQQQQQQIPMTRGSRAGGGVDQSLLDRSLEQHPPLTNMRQFDLEQQQKLQRKERPVNPLNYQKEFDDEESKFVIDQQQSMQQMQQQQQPSQQRMPLGMQAHDEEIIPTIKHKGQGEQQFESGEEQGGGNPYRSREAEDQLEELSEDVRSACVGLLPVIGETVCKKIFSKNWNMRDDGVKWIHEQMKSRRGGLQGNDSDQLAAILGAVNFTIGDKISSVYLSSVALLMSALERYSSTRLAMKGDVGGFLEVILSNLVERLGESNVRVRESAEEAFIALAKTSFVECSLAAKYLVATQVKGETKKQSKIGSVKHLVGRCKVLTVLIHDCGVSSNAIPLNQTLDFAVNQLEHPNQEVRTAANKTIVSLANVAGYSKVRPLLGNVKPPQMEILEKEFQKISAGGGHGATNAPKSTYQQQNDYDDEEEQQPILVQTNIGKKNQKQQKPTPQKQQQQQVPSQQMDIQAGSNQVCEFCGKVDRAFQDNQKYDIHLWKECPMLTTCQQCGQIIEISGLTEHLLAECQFKANFRRCPRCKEAIPLNQFKPHSEELSCNIAKPPNIANRCPLCHCDIPPSDIGWKKHLISEGCPNNERTTY